MADRSIVACSPRKRLGGKFAARLQRRGCIMCGKLIDHDVVVRGIDNHGHVVVVLGGRADHRWSADVDVLDRVHPGSAARHGCLEGIKIDHQKANRPDAMRHHCSLVFGIVQNAKKAAMDCGMQRLDPPVHDLRKAGDAGNLEDRQARLGQRLRRTTCRNQFDAQRYEPIGKGNEPGLVGNGQQSAAHGLGHRGLRVVCLWRPHTTFPARHKLSRRGAAPRQRTRPCRATCRSS